MCTVSGTSDLCGRSSGLLLLPSPVGGGGGERSFVESCSSVSEYDNIGGHDHCLLNHGRVNSFAGQDV